MQQDIDIYISTGHYQSSIQVMPTQGRAFNQNYQHKVALEQPETYKDCFKVAECP